MGPGDGSFALILQVVRQNSVEPGEQDIIIIIVPSNLFFSLFGCRGWCSCIDPGAALQFPSSAFPFGMGLAVAVPICPLQIGFQGWGGEGGCDGLVWNMGNKEMKSQGTIRPEVSLSLTFTSMGDDIQEIYMGSGRIMNGEEEEPPEGCAWGAGSPGPAAEQGLCGHVEVYLGDRDKCWHLLGCPADAVQGTSPVWVRKWE